MPCGRSRGENSFACTMRVFIWKMGWSSTSLVNLGLPSWLFDFLWLFDFHMILYILYMTFGLPLYNTFWIIIYNNPQNDVAYGESWHDMTWHWWHRNVKPFLLLLSLCFLENDLFSTSIYIRYEEPLVLLGLKLWSQTDVPLLSPNW